MKTRLLAASALFLSLTSCDKQASLTAPQDADMLTLAPRLELASGADTGLYNTALNVRVRLDAGDIHRDTLVAFAIRRCVFEGVARGTGYALSFRGISGAGDTIWTGSTSGIAGQNLSKGVTSQAVSVPVRFSDRTGPVLVSAPSDTAVGYMTTSVALAWTLGAEPGIAATLNGTSVAVDAQGQILSTAILAEGRNALVLVAADSLGNTTRDTVWITRASLANEADTASPVLLTAPRDTSLPYAVALYSVNWSFVPEPKLVGTLNDSALILPSNGLLQLNRSFDVGVKRLVLSLTDSVGNVRRDTVTVTRRSASLQSDNSAPVLLAVARDTTVASSATGLALSWRAAWEKGLSALVSGQGALIDSLGRITATVPLTQDTTRFVLALRDSLGNERLDTVAVTRRKASVDAAPTLLAAPNDTAVPYATNSLPLSWKLQSGSVRSVKLDGQILTGTAGTYARTMGLAAGTQSFVLVATDSYGQILRDTVTVTRLAAVDEDAPAILQKQHDTAVSKWTPTARVVWHVALEPKMTATINGVAVSDSLGYYSRILNLENGENRFSFSVMDSMGNSRRDTALVVKTDSQPSYGIPWRADIDYVPLIDERDQQIYLSVKIGNQIWMAQNLNYATSRSRWYNDSRDSGLKKGSLYRWVDLMQLDDTCEGKYCMDKVSKRHQGICPTGWRVPSVDDWDTLIGGIGDSLVAFTKLASQNGWTDFWGNNPWGGTDEYGFRLLPAGQYSENLFYYPGFVAYIATTSELYPNNPEYPGAIRGFVADRGGNLAGLKKVQLGKTQGMAVRCIKDQ